MYTRDRKKDEGEGNENAMKYGNGMTEVGEQSYTGRRLEMQRPVRHRQETGEIQARDQRDTGKRQGRYRQETGRRPGGYR